MYEAYFGYPGNAAIMQRAAARYPWLDLTAAGGVRPGEIEHGCRTPVERNADIF